VLHAEYGLPIRLLELGSSAGLNLLPDRYAYLVGPHVLVYPTSPVRFEQPWVGRPPAAYDVRPTIVERRGCDPAPLDVTSAHDRLVLSGFVWGDQVDRFQRLGAALDLAQQTGVRVDAAPASAWVEQHLAQQREGELTVVWHSVIWQYLSGPERVAVCAAVEAAGSRADDAAPLAAVGFEPRSAAGGPRRWKHTIRLRCWPGDARERILGVGGGHGPPVVWGDESAAAPAGTCGEDGGPGRGGSGSGRRG